MMQLCEDSITIPYAQIFKSSLSQGVFPDTWEMANIVPVHKKEAKYFVKTYRQISLLSIFSKVFERLLFFFSSPIFIAYSELWKTTLITEIKN